MVFNIKQNSTLPILKMKLYRDGRNDYNNFDERLENSIITFTMKDMTTGVYKVVNKTASIELKDPCGNNSENQYYVIYKFTADDTNRTGIYLGEFKIFFLNNELQSDGELIVPISEPLYINVIDSFIKSDII